MYMAGILFKHEMTELVTLTTTPNRKCSVYHKRMPVLIPSEYTEYWLNASTEEITPLLNHVNDEMIHISRAE
jgi:putative SOS response-associated peptidase YedK